MYRLWMFSCALFAVTSPCLRAQWQPMGPFGGTAAVVQVDPNTPGTVLAASNNGLLFRSKDNGETWKALPFPAQLRATLHAFVIDPRKPGVYYAGLSSDSPEHAGVYRSEDAGATWAHLPELKGKEIWSLAIWSGDSNLIAAGARDGVHLSQDGGATWKHISPPSNLEMAPVVSLAFDAKDSNSIYAGTPHLPWKTENGGTSWHPIHQGMVDDSDVFSIQVDASRPQRVFASACSGIYRSENAGATWTKMIGAKGASYRTYIISQDPKQPNLVFAGTTHGLAKSSDGGVTWRRLSEVATRWVAFDPAVPGRMFFATDEAGIQRSDDSGETLRQVNQGFCNRQMLTLASASGIAYTASVYEPVYGGVFRLKTEESSWERVASSGEQLLHVEASPAVPEKLFALSYSALLASSGGGKQWTRIPGPRGVRPTCFLGSVNGRDEMLVGSESGLFQSLDGGKTWQSVTGPFGGQKIRALSYLSNNGVAAVTAGGVFVSQDGSTWRTTAPIPNDVTVYDVVSAGEDHLIAGTSGGVIRSSDFGASWEPSYKDLGQTSVSALCEHPLRPETIFVAQYGVVYKSPDGGATWAPLLKGHAPIGSIKGLAVLPGSPDRLLALTQSQGVFALPLASASDKILSSTSGTGRSGKITTAQ